MLPVLNVQFVSSHAHCLSRCDFLTVTQILALNAGNPRVTIKDVEELREAKLHTSLRLLESHQNVIEIHHISAMELNRS